jgi:transposase
MRLNLKPRRVFSEDLKKEIVQRIELEKVGISQVSREYSVSPSAVYLWLDKYSRHLKKGEVMVVQKESEEKKSQELRTKIAELERIIGQKQMEIDFLNKVIEIGSEEVKVDIKKKFGGKLSSGSGQTEEKAPGK